MAKKHYLSPEIEGIDIDMVKLLEGTEPKLPPDPDDPFVAKEWCGDLFDTDDVVEE